ncbi:zinc ribbon domain-containing protein [Chloroflexota bacterium]
MGVARQLYQLQEVDLELESNEQALVRITGQLGESQAVVAARNKLSREQQHVEELKGQQRSAEWEVDDFTTKLAAIEDKLYGGRVANPKELANLQREADGLKSRRSQAEDRALEAMEKIAESEARVMALESELEGLEAEWQRTQQQLSAEAEQHKVIVADLKQKRQLLAASIDQPAVGSYDKVRKQKGRAVARVEGGTCRGCGITLSTAQLQQTKGDRLVQCASCGRILFPG